VPQQVTEAIQFFHLSHQPVVVMEGVITQHHMDTQVDLAEVDLVMEHIQLDLETLLL
jgi:hypothetical protein